MLPVVLILLGTSLVALAIHLGSVRIARAISELASEVSSLSPEVNVTVEAGEAQALAEPRAEKKSEGLFPESVLAEIASIKSEGFSKGGTATGELQESVSDQDVKSLAAALRRAR